jgi:FixJ family two-component response regulator
LLADIPVIFYTAGSYEREGRALAESCGVVHVLIKPSEPQVILQTVSTVLGVAPSHGVADDTVKKFDRHFLDLPNDSIDPDATVFIVDDDPAVRRLLSFVMESASLRVKAYASAEEFLDDFVVDVAGCLVVDVRMPGMSGIELLETLRSRGAELPAIVLSGHGDVPVVVRSMKLQVLDFLEKPVDNHILLAKVYQALREDTARWRTRRETAVIRRRIATLSSREGELLKLVIGGNANKQIAYALNISIKTVANHRANVMAKTQAINAADLVRMSIVAGICPST